MKDKKKVYLNSGIKVSVVLMENLFRVDDIKVDMPSKVLSDNVAKIAVIGVMVVAVI